jgi:hypothetical protein
MLFFKRSPQQSRGVIIPRVLIVGLTALLTLAPATAVAGQVLGRELLPTGTVRPCFPTQGAHRAFVQGERLQAAYGLLLERSPTFAAAVAAVESRNAMRIRIGYREHVMHGFEASMDGEQGGAVFLADGSSHHPAGTILCGVRVVFFTERLEEELLRAGGVAEDELLMDLAVMIAHEVYGHLIPFAEQDIPVWPTPCRDTDPGDEATSPGCAVERENRIRQELGVSGRYTYAHLDGPLLCALRGRPCFVRPGQHSVLRLAHDPRRDLRPVQSFEARPAERGFGELPR